MCIYSDLCQFNTRTFVYVKHGYLVYAKYGHYNVY